MYDWYEERTWVMLVLEYQRDWKDLYSYIDKKGIKEDKAHHLMLQLVRADQHCLKHEVLHNDIHSGNIMVDESGLHLKLTNFRMGRLVKSTGYTSKPREGAKCCIPPEALTRLQYLAMPATVWALGVVLYEMVHGFPPLQRLGVVRITGRNLTMKSFNAEYEYKTSKDYFLGKGAYGRVYRGTRKADGKLVAIKRVRLREEERCICYASHQN
ncbi:serine/threonine-protein kinase pim-2-like [Paramisgurnus dabryanus]|uniref:serine/threonine-protein kinase pim-2-like n=1 Tax=Paramisgurnus dabryanus TaxID=90735 RepID=UPI0031F39D6C